MDDGAQASPALAGKALLRRIELDALAEGAEFARRRMREMIEEHAGRLGALFPPDQGEDEDGGVRDLGGPRPR